jgi:hypothetical protein
LRGYFKVSIGTFTDKDHRPTEKEISSALGSSLSNWSSILEQIRKSSKVQEDFKFMYGKRYGWAVRFRLTGKLLTSLYPNLNHFVAQIILNTNQLLEVKTAELHENAQRAIEEANLYPEGKWLFIPVKTAVDTEDVKHLLELKRRKWL